MIQPTDPRWLGLALRSESDQPHEWRALAWVIRNRVESRRFPSTYLSVITAAWQFSYFNPWRGRDDYDTIWREALAGYAGDSSGWSENDYIEAAHCATETMREPRWRAPFSPSVFYFWSPVSMIPKGSDPSWAKELRVFTLGGIDPERFKFAE